MRISSGPLRTTAPAWTGEPTETLSGALSPVSIALSIAPSPFSTTPSAASASPAATSMAVPGSRSSEATRCVLPSARRTSALLPMRESSAPIPARVRVRMVASSARPASRKNSSMTALSK